MAGEKKSEEKAPEPKTFAERFEEAFRKTMAEEHEELSKLPKVHKPEEGEGVVEVVEPHGEKHFDL